VIPNQATRARRREAGRTWHQLPTAMANALAWDVILQLNLLVAIRVPVPNDSVDPDGVVMSKRKVPWYPVVRFQGRYYLVDHGNPWPTYRDYCKLLARPGDPLGDLCITSDGIVAKWADGAARRGYRRPTIVGVQEDVQPVLSLPVAGAITAAGTVRAELPGAGAGQDHEQLHGRIRGRLPGGDQSQLHQEKAG
jgi:hypothetical protein